jgi:hypothetical protein
MLHVHGGVVACVNELQFLSKLEEFQFMYFRSLEEHNLIMLWIAKKLRILFSGSSVLSE